MVPMKKITKIRQSQKMTRNLVSKDIDTALDTALQFSS